MGRVKIFQKSVYLRFCFSLSFNAMLGEIWFYNPQQKHVTTERENKIDSLMGLPLNYTS